MKNIVTVCTDYVSGGTFFSWTLEYLTGKDQYFGYNMPISDTPAFIDLPSNPLTKLNSHAFVANEFPVDNPNLGLSTVDNPDEAYFFSLDETDTYLELLQQQQTHVYVQNPGHERLAKIQDASKSVFRLVNDSMYYMNFNQRHHDADYCGNDDLLSRWLVKYFANSIEKFGGIENYYSRRELLSLIIRPHANSSHGPYKSFDSSKPHMLIHAHDMYHYFDSMVYDCFAYAGLAVNESRYEKWVQVWHQWRKIQKTRILFQSYLDRIVEYTVSGYDMDLTRFNLDIMQQAVIMQEIARKHDLTIAGYGVNEFTSTAQLHALLEPLIHKGILYE